MTTQTEFTLAAKATVDTIAADIVTFARKHATVRIAAYDNEKPYLEWFVAQIVPYLPTVEGEATKNGVTVKYVAGFDKKAERYKAAREAYKAAILPFWISRADSVTVDGETITGAIAMMPRDELARVPDGARKAAIQELRETIKNNVDQEWSRLLPKFDRPEADPNSDEYLVEQFLTMYTKRQKRAAKDGKEYVHDADLAAARDYLLAHLSAAQHAERDAEGAAILDNAGVSLAA
jgi:hypothetical protein